MKQKLLLLRLAFRLGRMFIVEMYKVLTDEVKNNTYPQENYKTCLDRAMAMIGKAIERPTRYCACLIAHHRNDSHVEDDCSEEITTLEVDMSVSDIKSVEASPGFWQS